MLITSPSVALVAATEIEHEEIQQYLEDIDAAEYLETLDKQEPTGCEAVAAIGGKLCYKSFKPKLNPNVTRVRDDLESYIGNINKIGHGSVIEHGWVTFIIWDVSRVVTHELCRHRAGTAISQESLRFVRLTDFHFWIPKILIDEDNENKEGMDLITTIINQSEQWQKEFARIYEIDKETKFSQKKKLTSAFRRFAPIGIGTALMFSMNMRAARHIIQMRTSRHAEEEIRLVFDKIASILVEKYPLMFKDFHRREIDGYGEWFSSNAAMPYDGEKMGDMIKVLKKVASGEDASKEAGKILNKWELL